MSGVERATHWARRVAVAFAGGWALTLVWGFATRVTFPLELEWMEGGVLHQADRFASGLPIYPAPSIDFVPFLYTPGYPILLGVLGLPLGGADLVLGRVVSIAATVATAWAIVVAVRGEGRSPAHGWVAAGLFAAGYVFTFRWYDLARPDSLYIALVAWALVKLRHARDDRRAAIVAGISMALAFWTKQTAASFVVASGIGVLLVAPRQLPWYAGTIAVIDGGGVLIGNAVTDGWLWTYIYELHQAHAFNDERFDKKTWGMFAHAAPWLVLWIALWGGHVVDRTRRRLRADDQAGKLRRLAADDRVRGAGYWCLMAAAGLLVSALGYSTAWAEPNAFIPGVVFGAIVVGISVPERGSLAVVGFSLAAVQLAFAWAVEPMYQPIQREGWSALAHSYAWQDTARTIPGARRTEAAAELRADLEASDGEVLALHRPWWSIVAGGAGHVGTMGVRDVRPEAQQRLQDELRASIADGRWAAIWFEGEPPRWLLAALRSGYRVQRRLHGDARVRPMSGWMSEAGVVTPYRADQVMLVGVGPRPVPAGTEVIADFESGFGRGRGEGFTVEGAFSIVAPPTGRLPWPGPYGGARLLSSGGARGDVRRTGAAQSPEVEVATGDRLEMLVGTTGRTRGLVVAILEGEHRLELTLPQTRHTLATLTWEVPPAYDGSRIRVRFEDEAPEAALYFDDLWVVRAQ